MTRYRVRPPYPTVPDAAQPDPEAVELTPEQAQGFADALAAMQPGDPEPAGLERPWSVSVIGTPYLPNGRMVDPGTIVRVGGVAMSHVARDRVRTYRPRGAGSHRPPTDPDPADGVTWELLLAAREAAEDGNDLTPGGVASRYAGPPTTGAGMLRAFGGRAGMRRFLKDGTRPGAI
jgi:hypothetical protein